MTIPNTEYHSIIRTNFDSDTDWEMLQEQIEAELDIEFEFVNEIAYKNKSPASLIKLCSPDYPHSLLVIADSQAFDSEEPTLLIVRVKDANERLRATLDGTNSIVANVSIGNMGLEEYVESVDEDGVFRGFESPDD